MPFCPKCRYEYDPQVSTCPDCEEPLVSRLPEPKDDDVESVDTGDWVCIGRLYSSMYADMLEEGLESKDIPVHVLSGTGYFGMTGQMGDNTFRPVGGGYSVLVPKKYAEDADIEAELILGEEWQRSRTGER